MAISINTTKKKQIQKKKTTTKPKVEKGKIKGSKEVSMYYSKKKELEEAQKDLKPLATEVAKLEADMLKKVDTIYKAESEVTLVGVDGETIELSAKGKKTTITDMDTAVDLLEGVKEGLAIELASFTLGNLNKYLTPEQYDSITEVVHAYKRKVTLT